MSRRASSNRWYATQSRDPFVKRREAAGYRSRAAFKLKELIERDRLCRPGQVVLDLGASPGGWSQVVGPLVGPAGLVVAVDILPMPPIAHVNFICGDALDDSTEVAIKHLLGERLADLVLSDMAPNLSGIRASDEARSLALAEQALSVARNFLRLRGTLLMKLFQYAGTDAFVRTLSLHFERVARRKPEASRRQSNEFYVVATGFRL
ncbi:MAG: RlmE family RNA methyltransferase [Gammaproteobacteria bacterium]|nr:RlmE family RNA methyltransferase [Gammaproteobacteria bacterium]